MFEKKGLFGTAVESASAAVVRAHQNVRRALSQQKQSHPSHAAAVPFLCALLLCAPFFLLFLYTHAVHTTATTTTTVAVIHL